MSAEALMHILVKNDPHHGGLGFVDYQIVELVLALVETPAFHKVIAVWSKAAFETAAQAAARADVLDVYEADAARPAAVAKHLGRLIKHKLQK